MEILTVSLLRGDVVSPLQEPGHNHTSPFTSLGPQPEVQDIGKQKNYHSPRFLLFLFSETQKDQKDNVISTPAFIFHLSLGMGVCDPANIPRKQNNFKKTVIGMNFNYCLFGLISGTYPPHPQSVLST